MVRCKQSVYPLLLTVLHEMSGSLESIKNTDKYFLV